MQLLRELIPNAARFGVLIDPSAPSAPSVIADLQVGAASLGLQLVFVNARTDSDLEAAFATFAQQHVAAVLVGSSALYSRRTEQLAVLAAHYALPAMFPLREYVGRSLAAMRPIGSEWTKVGSNKPHTAWAKTRLPRCKIGGTPLT